MPDLRDDTTEDGFHEIQLSGKQLVFLFMATTAVLIFVFLVGVLVGRDVAVKRADGPDLSATTVPVAPEGEATDPGAQPATPPAPGGDAALTYHDELKSNSASREKLPPPEPKPDPKIESPAPAEPPATVPDASQADVPTSGRPGAWVIQVIALKERPAAAALVQRLTGKGYPAFLESPAAGIYRVRVGRYKDRREAEQVSRRLEREEQFRSVISR